MPVAFVSPGVRLCLSGITCWLKRPGLVAAERDGLYGSVPTRMCHELAGIPGTGLGTAGTTGRGHPCRATTDHLHLPVLPVTPGGNPSVECVFCCVSPLHGSPGFSSLLATMATTTQLLQGEEQPWPPHAQGAGAAAQGLESVCLCLQASSERGFALAVSLLNIDLLGCPKAAALEGTACTPSEQGSHLQPLGGTPRFGCSLPPSLLTSALSVGEKMEPPRPLIALAANEVGGTR